MNVAYLLIGGNIGNRLKTLQESTILIEKKCGRIGRVSGVYETAAWGLEQQEPFLNQAIELHTELPPEALLKLLLDIEKRLGRVRLQKFGPRVIDIDIIFYNDLIFTKQQLTIPHPHMQNRRFVLVPLAEIAPRKEHPVLKKSVQELLNNCPDPLEVKEFEIPLQ